MSDKLNPGETADNGAINAQTTAEPLPHYGMAMAEEARSRESHYNEMNPCDKFAIERGHEFETEEAFNAALNRIKKCWNGKALTEDEFVEEAKPWYKNYVGWNEENARAVYRNLWQLAMWNRIKPTEIYRYARYGWCLQYPRAIVAYEVEGGRWEANNCEDEISEADAIVRVNGEWGFEASRIKIVGKAFYNATDWQFIRFDCAHGTWLWKNGGLYGVVK